MQNKIWFKTLKQTLPSPSQLSDLEEPLSQFSKQGKIFVEIYQLSLTFLMIAFFPFLNCRKEGEHPLSYRNFGKRLWVEGSPSFEKSTFLI